jgi:DnaK suppressor protein
MSALSQKELQSFRTLLQNQQASLRQAVHDALVRSGDKAYIDLAGQVHDAGDESVADLLSDANIADLRSHTQQALDIQAALERMAEGTYGVCIDCGGDIAPARLHAYPTAKRCQACQARHEDQRRDRTPSL